MSLPVLSNPAYNRSARRASAMQGLTPRSHGWAVARTSGVGRRRRPSVVVRALRRRIHGAPDAGMTTAEYAIGTIAACAFAAILYRVVTSDAVSGALGQLLDRALHAV